MEFKVILVLMGVVAFTTATVVQQCPSGPEALKVVIKDCDVEPCRLLNTAVMDITFKTSNSSYTLVPKVRAKVGPLTVTYPLPGDLQDGCLSLLNGYCPMDAGEVLVYHLEMPVSSFPKIAVNLEFSLLGDNGIVFQCFKVDCVVVDA